LIYERLKRKKEEKRFPRFVLLEFIFEEGKKKKKKKKKKNKKKKKKRKN
jgi:hypothetical protein